jgi:hypothetical protein
MKKILATLAFLLLLPTAIQAQKTHSSEQEEKPHLVVFVIGLRNDQLNDYMTNLISNELSRTYTIIPRTDAIKQKIQELKEYEDAGHIDDRELIEWGHQHNVSVLCLVTVAIVDEYLFSAQLTDVKTNTLLGNAEYDIPTLAGEDLKKAAAAIAGQLQRKRK